jgi:hypothetical protein
MEVFSVSERSSTGIVRVGLGLSTVFKSGWL